MGKSRGKKYYQQSIKYFNEGELQKSLKICEKGIADDLKNASLLNLKGLLLYLKGDLKGSVATWKINADYNDDSIAKTYIEDAKADREKLKFIDEGEALLVNLHVDKALEKFNLCSKSDFNSIKVNTDIALCYIKKGEYENAGAYITKVLQIDKYNQKAIQIANDIENYGSIKLEAKKNDKKISRYILIAVILLIVAGALFTFKLRQNSDNAELSQIPETINNSESTITETATSEPEASKTETKPEVTIQDVQSSVAAGNYEDAYAKIKSINKNNLNDNDKNVYSEVVKVIEDKGVTFFYNQGMTYYKNQQYEKAKDYFSKAYEYGEKNYLYPDIIFFNGAIDDKTKNNNGAIKFYENYYNNYKTGGYFEETLYNLAILYKGIDKDKSNKYAAELKYDHSSSMYNNEKISDIVNGK